MQSARDVPIKSLSELYRHIPRKAFSMEPFLGLSRGCFREYFVNIFGAVRDRLQILLLVIREFKQIT